MIIVSYIASLLVLVTLFCELRRDLMMLQQNSYRNERYMKWLKVSADTTSMTRMLAMILVLFGATTFKVHNTVTVLVCVFAVLTSLKLSRAKHKKPLVMTARAKRILTTDIVLVIAILAAASALVMAIDPYLLMMMALACFCFSHSLTMAANYILKPVENHINRGFYNAAAERLSSMPELKIVGITGSYGKTSTKHYLHRILSEHFDVCMTPGSFNTTLGVVRTINEYLKPYNQVFIVEMGAKQHGDIKEICDLVHPDMGIVTAVGPQHLESFGTINDVADTKFELVDSLTGKADAVAVINNDFDPIKERVVTNVPVVRYAINDDDSVDFHAENITYSSRGTTFDIVAKDGFRLTLSTHLVGECNISNLIASVIIAKRLGVPDDKIKYAVQRIEQVEHRLNMKTTPGGLTIIDDAFNSNPTGSKMALDVLAGMTSGRRIIITPGMIELGEQQEELNRQFGFKIASSADLALIVGQYNRQAITDGLKDAGKEEGFYLLFDSFAQAQAYLNTIAKAGDTVLYENDLPDTFK